MEKITEVFHHQVLEVVIMVGKGVQAQIAIHIRQYHQVDLHMLQDFQNAQHSQMNLEMFLDTKWRIHTCQMVSITFRLLPMITQINTKKAMQVTVQSK